MKKFRFGTIHADFLTQKEALDIIESLATAGKGGMVVTPNVDHVVQAESNPALRNVYEHAALSLVDGMPLKWMSALLGHPLPEKISGSDLVRPLLKRAAEKRLKVYFLGSAPGVGQKAADILRKEMPSLKIVGIESPPVGFERDETTERNIMDKVIAAKPDFVLVALGCPKQELLMARWYKQLSPAVLLGIGASLDFIAGRIQRSPAWMSRMGAEWLYRLAKDPKRLVKRYLVHDIAIVPIFLKMCRTAKADRVFFKD